MRLDRFPIWQAGWIYTESLANELEFRNVKYEKNEGWNYFVRAPGHRFDWPMPGNTRIFETKEEAIRFQIRLREFEIYQLKKILQREK